jgi:hypothetical protein
VADELLKLTPTQRIKIMRLDAMKRVQQEREFRERGRLFVGSAPTSECAAERAKLFREWDKLIEFYESKSPPHLIRHLRDLYERPETQKDSRQMRFVVDVDELRKYEAELWEKLKDKGGKRKGQWVSASKKRRRR